MESSFVEPYWYNVTNLTGSWAPPLPTTGSPTERDMPSAKITSFKLKQVKDFFYEDNYNKRYKKKNMLNSIINDFIYNSTR